MKVIYDIHSSFEEGRNGKLLTDSVEIEGSTEEEINKEFNYYLNNNFYKDLERQCDTKFSNVELNGQLQEITICIEKCPTDEDGNIVEEDCSTDYVILSYHPFIGLVEDEKEAQRLLDEQLDEIRKEDEEEERNF